MFFDQILLDSQVWQVHHHKPQYFMVTDFHLKFRSCFWCACTFLHEIHDTRFMCPYVSLWMFMQIILLQKMQDIVKKFKWTIFSNTQHNEILEICTLGCISGHLFGLCRFLKSHNVSKHITKLFNQALSSKVHLIWLREFRKNGWDITDSGVENSTSVLVANRLFVVHHK